MFSTHTDENVLAALAGNDASAFEELYERYRDEVYTYAMVLVKFPDLAEDLVQDVFIRLWDARNKITIQKTLRSYLFRICHNRAYDMHLEIARNQQLKERFMEYFGQDNAGASQEEELVQYEELMQEALGWLTPQRRRIYEMCKLERKSYAEVAAALNISPNTVKNHMVQTSVLLKDFVKKHAIRLPITLLWVWSDFF